jgi:hypothetical protein
MQFFGKRNAEDPAAFWRATAEKRGGKIGFLTYASLLGRSSDTVLDRPGLLYTVGPAVWFEDFERDNWLTNVMGRTSTFVKTEITFSIPDVAFTRLVSRASALACIAGKREPAQVPAATTLSRFLGTPFVEVGLRDGTALFIDVIRRKEFMTLLGGAAEPPRT